MTNYNQRKHALCPHCQGQKTTSRYEEGEKITERGMVLTTCPVCEGEGIVIQEIKYLTLKAFNYETITKPTT